MEMWKVHRYDEDSEYDTRPLRSHYNWLFDGQSGFRTSYRSLEKAETSALLAIL